MYLIVGLGNPGKQYENTRHNVGFDVIDIFKSKYNLQFRQKGSGEYAKCTIFNQECIFLKPLTYMNLSGKAVFEYAKFFKIQEDKIIIVYDDKDISSGEIKLRKKGSSAGHNGIKSILNNFKDFLRVRIGIGNPKFKHDMINYVIGKVSKEEYMILKKGEEKAVKAIEDIIKNGMDYAMNNNNTSKPNVRKNNQNKNNKKGEKKMDKIYITGHKNPDTDSIISAIVAEDIFTKLGYNVTAIAQGVPSEETQFVLDAINRKAPEVHTKLEAGSHVILVDHNNKEETLDNIDELIIDRVIDHHAVKMIVGYPLYYRAEVVGCTNTILFKMYKENNLEISKEMALAMLSAIVSDTLLLKSPTTTEEDILTIKELEKIAEVNANEYGLKMLKAGTNLSKYSIDEILNLDAKKVKIGDNTVMVSQITTVDIQEHMNEKTEFEARMNEIIKEQNLDLFMFLITDIITTNSQVIVLGEKAKIIEEGYSVKLEDNTALLEGVMSRKKQVIPVITKLLS